MRRPCPDIVRYCWRTLIPRDLKTWILLILTVNITAANIYLYFFVTNVQKTVGNELGRLDRAIFLHGKAEGLLRYLSEYSAIDALIKNARNGGLVKLNENTIGRLYSVNYRIKNNMSESPGELQPESLSVYGLDVSDSGEALYLYRRILTRNRPVPKLIIDIGANDGFLSSNSFNFIKWGWSAILVEPLPENMELALKNAQSFLDKAGLQKVKFAKVALGDADGLVEFRLPKDPGAMTGEIFNENQNEDEFGVKYKTIPVQSMTVKSFARRYNVSENIGILSIDAEGSGLSILRQWLKLGYRPYYICFETIHRGELRSDTRNYVESFGYQLISTRHWNDIYEYQKIKT